VVPEPGAGSAPAGAAAPRAETGAADLIAPSICRLGPLQLRDAVVASLGPDPLHEDADVDLVRRRFASDRRPIGAVLLDQSVLAGVGNVIRTEALFLEGLDPWIPAAALDRARFDRLWATLTGIMERSAVDGRIVTADGVGRDARFIYKRETCRRCGASVERPIVGGRRMDRCPKEQPTWSETPAAAELPG
jgi:endonuclease VIII